VDCYSITFSPPSPLKIQIPGKHSNIDQISIKNIKTTWSILSQKWLTFKKFCDYITNARNYKIHVLFLLAFITHFTVHNLGCSCILCVFVDKRFRQPIFITSYS
jgi:hypothetical protein